MDKPQGENLGSRERYWSELGVEEKIERMRGEVKRAQKEVITLRLENQILKEHSHTKAGQIVIPMTNRYGEATGIGHGRGLPEGENLFF